MRPCSMASPITRSSAAAPEKVCAERAVAPNAAHQKRKPGTVSLFPANRAGNRDTVPGFLADRKRHRIAGGPVHHQLKPMRAARECGGHLRVHLIQAYEPRRETGPRRSLGLAVDQNRSEEHTSELQSL